MLKSFNAREKILEIIFKFPTTPFTVRDLAKKVGSTPPTVSKIVKELKNEGIVRINRKKKLFEITGNIESERFREMKRVYNILSLFELKKLLIKEYTPTLICLFGSYAFGEDIENSDIDLFVETKKNIDLDLTKFEKKLNRKIHLITGDLNTLPKELKESILTGVVLYGSVRI